jgi:hypothetical protein
MEAQKKCFCANNDNGGPYWSQTAHPNNFDSSPHKFVQNWDAPILVIHNEKDFRVPITARHGSLSLRLKSKVCQADSYISLTKTIGW